MINSASVMDTDHCGKSDRAEGAFGLELPKCSFEVVSLLLRVRAQVLATHSSG